MSCDVQVPLLLADKVQATLDVVAREAQLVTERHPPAHLALGTWLRQRVSKSADAVTTGLLVFGGVVCSTRTHTHTHNTFSVAYLCTVDEVEVLRLEVIL